MKSAIKNEDEVTEICYRSFAAATAPATGPIYSVVYYRTTTAVLSPASIARSVAAEVALAMARLR